MERWYTGGEEYYLTFVNGNHELRKLTNEETGDYDVIESGHFEKCKATMNEIIANNIDYDYNL